jgi:hypothetical protein
VVKFGGSVTVDGGPGSGPRPGGGQNANEKGRAKYREQAHKAESASNHAVGREGHVFAHEQHKAAAKMANKLGLKANAANHEHKAEFHLNSANRMAG